ncbi:hypothetical protein [Xenorhabdus littoralis]|uniref:hypothetical protein n=1 Tax=Xenorhabdus littoralis TaxID=2582835 RepID=UPI0029E8022A|nr:hypothetical protein [Xenorhabdus sp. Reich]
MSNYIDLAIWGKEADSERLFSMVNSSFDMIFSDKKDGEHLARRETCSLAGWP